MSITMHADEPIPGVGADGRPDPAYAAALGLRPAPTGRRAAAFAIDATGWALLSIPAVIAAVQLVPVVMAGSATDLGTLAGPLVLSAVGQVLLTAYGLTQLGLHGRRGITIGKASLGLRSVNAATFARPGFWRVVLRVLVLWASQVVLPIVGPAICFASGLWDPEGRGRSWLDRVGRCLVLDVRRGLDPFDGKALRFARRQVESAPFAERPDLPSLASDRGIDERTFIPAARSSSGVVAAPPASRPEATVGAWTPPPVAEVAPPPATTSPSAAGPSPTATRASATLVFGDGARVAASGTTLIGRDPARADGDPERALLLPVADPTMGLSKTHAAVVVDEHGVHVVDRWSSNGTAIVEADGRSRELEAGVPHPLPAGASVRLGGVEFRVEEVRA
ncbi:RDD family protein [Agromyces sp. NDB4Y10]|uniref:RDD family protein n=1 Tax=Agromyces sp. NDB4Y10 TaxID=1775951 RepID=UPI0008367EDE|nr:RDD family protein [Agromyces sp. NDB4Y10]